MLKKVGFFLMFFSFNLNAMKQFPANITTAQEAKTYMETRFKGHPREQFILRDLKKAYQQKFGVSYPQLPGKPTNGNEKPKPPPGPSKLSNAQKQALSNVQGTGVVQRLQAVMNTAQGGARTEIKNTLQQVLSEY